jgi:hypothetical protein
MNGDAHIAVTGSCRRCGAAVLASAKPGPVYRCMAECDRCHYRTILRDDPIDLPLTESLKPFFSAEEIESALGQADVGSVCIAVLQRSFDKASELVQEHREVAIAGLLHLMDRREQQLGQLFTDPKYNEMVAERFATIDASICQTMYLLLLQHGPIILPDRPIPTPVISAIVGQQIFPLLGSLVTIVKLLMPVLCDGLARLHWADGHIRLEKLEKHALMVESGINMLLQEQRDERDAPRPEVTEQRGLIVSEPCRRALALATGIDVAYLTKLLEARMQRLIDQRIGVRRGEIVYISSALLTQEIDAIFRKLTLDLGTIQRFRAPCFFDTGPLRTDATSPASIAETPAINWTAYYPSYVAQSPTNGSAVYLTSPRTWQGMLMSLAQRPAYALHQVHETIAGDPARRHDVAELRTLIRETHREIEALAGQAARDAGWRCRTSVEAFGSTPLTEGEIDLLATANVGDASIILLAEVKNSDNVMAVPGSSERVAALVTHAETQLRRKGSWIAEHWDETLNFFGHTAVSSKRQRRRLLRVIVTARPLAVHHFREFPGTSVAGFRSLAKDLLQVDHDAWESPWRIHWTEIAR